MNFVNIYTEGLDWPSGSWFGETFAEKQGETIVPQEVIKRDSQKRYLYVPQASGLKMHLKPECFLHGLGAVGLGFIISRLQSSSFLLPLYISIIST
jgi:hypothetical protein